LREVELLNGGEDLGSGWEDEMISAINKDIPLKNHYISNLGVFQYCNPPGFEINLMLFLQPWLPLLIQSN
jgi:hypothetical protein